jgi:hypothetical protein
MAEIVNFPKIGENEKLKTRLALEGNNMALAVLEQLARGKLEDCMKDLGMTKFNYASDFDDIRIEFTIRKLF